MGILLDAKLIPLYRVLAARADAPLARSGRFASFGRFTGGIVGDRCKVQVVRFAQDGSVWFGPVKLPRLGGDVFPSQVRLFAVELAESDEVQVVGGLELAGLKEEERGDQIRVAADDAEPAAELLPRGTPSPLPVREAAVETVPNHEDMSCSEHQSRLSKGVIAKVVQRLKLWAQFVTPVLGTDEKSHRDGGFCLLQSVTETVSISRIANRWG